MSASNLHRPSTSLIRRLGRGLRRVLGPGTTAMIGLALVTSAVASSSKPTPPVGLTPVEPHVEVSGSVNWSDVSGETAAQSFVLGPKHKRRALHGIGWWEDSDEPCKFEVYAKNLAGDGGHRRFSEEICKGSPGSKKGVNRSASTEFITAIKACLTNKKDPHKDKLKGLQLYGRIVDPGSGALGGENGPDIAQRPHCKDWASKVACPEGQVATKLEVFYREKSKQHVFATGVRLGCRELVYVDPFSG